MAGVVAGAPDTMVAGWWSPSSTTTRSSSAYVERKETTDCREYSIEWAYAARTRPASGQMSASEGSVSGIPS